jgi:hypothetical protein
MPRTSNGGQHGDPPRNGSAVTVDQPPTGRVSIRISVDLGDGHTTRDAVPLARWIEDVAVTLHRLSSEVSELKAANSRLADDFDRLASQAGLSESEIRSVLEPVFSGLDRRIANVDGRLDDLLAQRDNQQRDDQQSGDKRSEDDMAHYDYATKFQALVEQSVIGLVRDTGQQQRPRFHRKAEQVADVCRSLFGEAPPDPKRIQAILEPGAHLRPQIPARIADTCAAAVALRTKITRGRSQRWVFDAQPNVPVDPGRQEVWTGCPPEGLVLFVVVPAYVVDVDTWLSKQIVFTAASDDMRGLDEGTP